MTAYSCASISRRGVVVLGLTLALQAAAGQGAQAEHGALADRLDVIDLRGVAYAGARREPRAVIWLEPHGTSSPRANAKPTVVLTQRNLTFLPHVLAVTTGTTVQFPNEDRVFHNVFSFHDSERFDLGTYPVGSQKQVVFSKPGVSRLLCNIHPNMAGYVVAVDSPYVAASKRDGSFAIGDVPLGSYTYHAWRPSGPELTGTWTVARESAGTARLTVVWP